MLKESCYFSLTGSYESEEFEDSGWAAGSAWTMQAMIGMQIRDHPCLFCSIITEVNCVVVDEAIKLSQLDNLERPSSR